MGQEQPSWQVVILDEKQVFSNELLITRVEGRESSISNMTSGLWKSMACLVHHLSKIVEQRPTGKESRAVALTDAAEALNNFKYKKEGTLLTDLQHGGWPAKQLVVMINYLQQNGIASLSMKSLLPV